MVHLSAKLPAYTGAYNVGVVDIEIPVDKPRVVGKSTFKHSGKPAFQLDTVAFSLYYPANTSDTVKTPKTHHPWAPRPLSLHAVGYAKLAHISNFVTDRLFTFLLGVLVGPNVIPAAVDVPLYSLPPTSNKPRYDEQNPTSPTAESKPLDPRKLPVIVFSHGYAGAAQHYSQYCGELASRGYVVAIIAHRDGSGAGTIVMPPGGPQRTVHPLARGNLSRDGVTPDELTLKEEMLSFREAEVAETVRVLQRINAGEGPALFAANPRNEGVYLVDFENRLDIDRIIIGGHSFGATLALRTLKNGPSTSMPFTAGIILDPGKHSGPLNDDVSVPLLVIHSNSWSGKISIFMGRPHFSVVRDIVLGLVNERGVPAWFMTSRGTAHPSITDAPLLQPALLAWTTGAQLDVHEALKQYVHAADEFVNFLRVGRCGPILGSPVMFEEYSCQPWHNTPEKTVPEDVASHWQVHVAPSGETLAQEGRLARLWRRTSLRMKTVRRLSSKGRESTGL